MLQKPVAANQPNHEKSPSSRCLHFAYRTGFALPSLDLHKFREAFRGKIEEHKGSIIGHIGLMLTIDNVRKAVQELDPDGELYDIFTFRSSEIVEVAKEFELVFYPEWVNKVLDII